jgi:DNA-binding MarR family transcriptional regulator
VTDPHAAARLPYSAPSPLYLRDEELIRGIELLDFAHRTLFAEPDRRLAELGIGRTHQRIVHLIGRHPGIPMGDLIEVLQITKQSLSRMVSDLIAGGFLTRAPDRADRRQRRLWLTEQGRQLDEELDGRLRRRLAGAYRAAGAEAVAGYHKVLLGLVDERARRLMRNAG